MYAVCRRCRSPFKQNSKNHAFCSKKCEKEERSMLYTSEEYRMWRREYQKSEKYRKMRRMYENDLLKSNIEYKLRKNVARAVRKHLIQEVWAPIRNLQKFLPFTMTELKAHLEAQFEPFMNWENYGSIKKGKFERKWNIDHIIPQNLWFITSLDSPQFKECWDLDNLRPLEVRANSKKGSK